MWPKGGMSVTLEGIKILPFQESFESMILQRLNIIVISPAQSVRVYERLSDHSLCPGGRLLQTYMRGGGCVTTIPPAEKVYSRSYFPTIT